MGRFRLISRSPHLAGLLLALLLVLPWGTVSFSPMNFTVQITPDLGLAWAFNDPNINLIVNKTTAGHASIGLGKAMSDADVLQIETFGGVLTVQDCYMAGHVAPICSESQDWTVVDQQISDTGFKVEVKRAQQTRHVTSTLSLGDRYFKHEHTQVLLWTVGIDILVFMGRFMKGYNRYFDAHSWPSLAILIASLIFRDRGRNDPISGTGVAKDFHNALAVVLVVLTILIIFNGIMVRAVIEFIKIQSMVKNLTMYRYLHLGLGILTWIIARAMVISGCMMFATNYGSLLLILVLIETALVVIIFLTIELVRKWKRKVWVGKIKEELIQTHQSSDEDKQLLNDLRSRVTVEELNIRYPNRNVMIYMNKVIDMKGYIHPAWRTVDLPGVQVKRDFEIPQ